MTAPPSLLALGAAGAVIAGVAVAAGATTVPTVVALGLGAALALTLILVSVGYETAAAAAFLTVGVIEVEPAPADVLFAMLILVALLSGRLDLRSAPRSAMGLAAAFVALNLLACIAAPDLPTAVSYLMVTVYLIALGLWTSGYVDGPHRARRVVSCYVVGATAAAVAGTAAVLVRFPGSTRLTDGSGSRANAAFKDANVFGPFLVVAVVLVAVELLEPGLLRWRPSVKLAALSVLGVGVVFSFSRGAWVNLTVALVVLAVTYAFDRRRAGRGLVVVALAVSMLVVGAVAVTATGSVPFLEHRAGRQTYDADRFGAQRFGVETATTHPFGAGPGQFESLSPVSAHSIYVRALAEEGVVGFVVIIALLLATLLLAVGNLRRGSTAVGVSTRALLALWCGLLVNSLVVDTLHWRHLWIVAGLIWAGAVNRAPDHRPTPARLEPGLEEALA